MGIARRPEGIDDAQGPERSHVTHSRMGNRRVGATLELMSSIVLLAEDHPGTAGFTRLGSSDRASTSLHFLLDRQLKGGGSTHCYPTSRTFSRDEEAVCLLLTSTPRLLATPPAPSGRAEADGGVDLHHPIFGRADLHRPNTLDRTPLLLRCADSPKSVELAGPPPSRT
jgi:hypothetical protein